MTNEPRDEPLPTVSAGLCDQDDVDEAVRRAAICYKIWVKEGYPAYCPMEARVIVRLANQLAESRSREAPREQEREARVASNLKGLQSAAKEIARELTVNGSADHQKLGRDLLHAVILSRTIDIRNCPTCGGIINLPRPAFKSDEAWCQCEVASSLSGDTINHD